MFPKNKSHPYRTCPNCGEMMTPQYLGVDDEQWICVSCEYSDEGADDDYDLDDAIYSMMECGLERDNTCYMTGSEYCDWVCPNGFLATGGVKRRGNLKND